MMDKRTKRTVQIFRDVTNFKWNFFYNKNELCFELYLSNRICHLGQQSVTKASLLFIKKCGL